jgi:hypothetical protein
LVLFFVKIVLIINFNDENLASNIYGVIFLAGVLGGIVFLLLKVSGDLPAPSDYRKLKVFTNVLAVLLMILAIPLVLYSIVIVFTLEKDFLWGLFTLAAGVIMIVFAVMLLILRSR